MKSIDNAKKYLLTELPSADYLAKATLKTVRQGYLRKEGACEAKVVEYKEKDEYSVIVKSSESAGREVSKLLISKEIFELLFQGSADQRISKKRYELKDGDFILRFDDFIEDTKLGKIKMLEVDVAPGVAGRKAEDYSFPDEPWAQGRKDVSDDPAYLNRNLAN